jgi:hypothetical protein
MLIAEVGWSAERARRYRDLATSVAEPAFDRALAIGSEVRQAARAGTVAALAGAVAELREIQARCQEGINHVRRSVRYQHLLAAFEAGDSTRAAELASAVFDGVSASPASQTLYSPVAIAGGKSVDHFLPATICAERIRTVADEGLSGASDAGVSSPGSDESIRPLRLSETHDESESPISLAFAPTALPGLLGRLTDSDEMLFYARRLRAEFVVSCTSRVSDEWWGIRPDAYRRYLEDLKEALTARSLVLVIEPPDRASS